MKEKHQFLLIGLKLEREISCSFTYVNRVKLETIATLYEDEYSHLNHSSLIPSKKSRLFMMISIEVSTESAKLCPLFSYT